MIKFKVTELMNYISSITSKDYVLNKLEVEGEISNLKLHANSGNAYFSIKDDISRINCILYDFSDNENIKKVKDGDQVSLLCSVSLNERDGSLNLRVEEVEKVGLGNLYEKFLKLKNEMDREGYFDLKYKKELPQFPKKIGVITASDGAAVRDIISVSLRRDPNISIYVYPAVVQGHNSERSLLRGLDYFENTDMDVIIIGRGGGSYEDLDSFNSKEVALKIFNYDIPIVSAVGHEIDYVISDFVADKRAATPSVAAEIVVPDMYKFLKTTRESVVRIKDKTYFKIDTLDKDLERKKDSLDIKNLEKIIDDKLNFCKRQILDCGNLINYKINLQNEKLQSISKNIDIKKINEKVSNIETKNKTSMEKISTIVSQKLSIAEERLKTSKSEMDKWNITLMLNYGYSILTDKDNNIINKLNDTKIGDELTALLSDGQIKLKVIDKGEN